MIGRSTGKSFLKIAFTKVNPALVELKVIMPAPDTGLLASSVEPALFLALNRWSISPSDYNPSGIPSSNYFLVPFPYFWEWIKQNLHIETFFGHSDNAVKAQIWIAIAVYLLIAIFKKKFKLESPLSKILHFLSGILFEQIPIQQVFPELNYNYPDHPPAEQLSLLDF